MYLTNCARHLVPGSNNALTLLLNVEEYEIMRGQQIDAGVKVRSIHTYHEHREHSVI